MEHRVDRGADVVFAAATVTITGTGSAGGTPDEIQLDLDISALAASVATALDTANAAMSQVQAVLRDKGVTDLGTTGLSVYPRYGDDGAVTGHEVTESIAVRLQDLTRAGEMVSAACDAGGDAVRVRGLTLGFCDDRQLLAAAWAAAISDARTRAEQYAAAAGRMLGAVLTIQEGNSDATAPPLLKGMIQADYESSPVPIAAGTRLVTAFVTVTYALD
jgi:uncharacterized protein